MSHEALVEQVKQLPEEEFNADMKKGLDDIKAGCVKPVKEAFSDIKKRFA
ncbi:MAG: hypothetical protein K5930_00470 [Treponemataceae bacterium]|nr:hypothetical protein [Treponemataceae bacterium]